MSLKLAIWDMDGTIVDSRKVIQDAMVQAFRDRGLPEPEYDRTRRIVGLSLHDACGTLAPPDLSVDELDRLVEAYRDAFILGRTRPGFREPLYEGAIDSLVRLRDEGWLIAMATGKSHRGIRAIFDQHPLESFFDTIWCADDGPGKPHPFMIEQAMGALGVDTHQTLMIGDATFDIQMARAAGVKSLGVSWGFGEIDELHSAGAHEVHETFESLNKSLSEFTLP